MRRSEIDEFEKLTSQISAVYEEISILSKKQPNDAVNKFKLQFINDLFARANSLLGEDYIPFNGFTEFDLDNVPSNSDTVLMLSQYIECLEKLRAEHRQVLLLSRIEGLTVNDIATRMERSPSTIKYFLTCALQELKKHFGDTESFHLPDRQFNTGGPRDE